MMGLALLPDEQIIHRTRGHWLPYGAAIAWFLVALAAVGGAFFGKEDWRQPLLVGAGILASVGFLSAAAAWLRLMSREYTVTNRRVVVRQGLLARRSSELLLSKVESIEVDQSLLGRLLGYGTLIVHGTGGMPTRIADVPRPDEFRNAIQAQAGSPRNR